MNEIKIIGVLKQDFKLHYEYKGEKFYINYIECERTSGAIDTLPVVISENVTMLESFKAGDIVEVVGEVRTRNDENRIVILLSWMVIYVKLQYTD